MPGAPPVPQIAVADCQTLAPVLSPVETATTRRFLMIDFHKRAQVPASVALLLALAAPASAQSTNALPDLTTSMSTFDPYRVAGLPDAAKAAVAQAKAKMKSGEVLGFVFAASPDMKVWTLNSAPKTMANYIPSDSGRQALEVCEFEAGRPCAILAVNGYEARRNAGGAAFQPNMLISRPGDFDPAVLPFAAESARAEAAEYLKAQGPRAFALTTTGLWLWRGGADIVQAIDKTMADCAAAFKPAPCLLYAVNDRVVFVAR